MKEYKETQFEVLLNDVKACLQKLIMIYCQRAMFHFDELGALASCGIRFNPYMVAERHSLSVWNWDEVDVLREWLKDYEDEWREHRDDGRYLEYLCQRMTCVCFWNLHMMLGKASLKSPRVTVESVDGGIGFRLVVEDSYGDSGTQKYLAFVMKTKVCVYLHDERQIEAGRPDLELVHVAYGDSWEEIKARLNAPDPMTQDELVEAFASYPDIQDSLKEHPEKIFWPKDKICKHCGKRIVSLYYESPAWTWEEFCGRAGILYICPYCKEDDHFECETMS